MRAAICLLAILFSIPLDAQPSWRPIGRILSGPTVIEIVPLSGDRLVVSTGSSVRAFIDGRWVTATGLTGLGTNLASRLVRSAAGTLFVSMGGVGTFQSTDDGRSWTRRETEVAAASSTALYRQSPFTDSLQRSTDEGRTWQTVTQPVGYRVLDLAADHRVREIIAWRGSPTSSIAISSDDGDTWTSLTPAFDSARATGVRVTATSMLVRTDRTSSTDAAMWRSTDAGRTWKRLVNDSTYFDTYRIIEGPVGTLLRVDYFGTYISFDLGVTWRPTAPGLCDEHSQFVSALALDDELRIIAATLSGGLARYELGSWIDLGFAEPISPFAIRQFGSVLYARVDNTGWESRDGGDSWSCAAGAPEAIDARGVWYRARRQIEHSTDQGGSWSVVGNVFSGVPYYSSYDPTVTARGTVLGVYAYDAGDESSGVLRLRDDGTWQTIQRHDEIVTGELLASPDSTLYYRGGPRLDRSTDDGLTWHTVDSSWRTSLVAASDGTLYAFGDTGGGQRAFRSTDHGATWVLLDWGSRIPYSLKPHGLRGLIAVYADSTGAPLVGYSDDQGATIAEIMTGLDGALPQRIFDTGSDVAILGTNRGLFRLDLVTGIDVEPEIRDLDLTLRDEH
ncbi:MAG TPA: hypothetical protein VNA88_07345 [Candidatus Kapabacteria bacterium]|nr:hypothetical protein [Candidatus Kapabacteria bacterium]